MKRQRESRPSWETEAAEDHTGDAIRNSLRHTLTELAYIAWPRPWQWLLGFAVALVVLVVLP